MRGLATPPHPRIYRVPPPPPRALNKNYGFKKNYGKNVTWNLVYKNKLFLYLYVLE